MICRVFGRSHSYPPIYHEDIFIKRTFSNISSKHPPLLTEQSEKPWVSGNMKKGSSSVAWWSKRHRTGKEEAPWLYVGIDYQKRYSQVNAFDEKEELSPQSPGQAEVITPSQNRCRSIGCPACVTRTQISFPSLSPLGSSVVNTCAVCRG